MGKLIKFSIFLLAAGGLFLFLNSKNNINIKEGLGDVFDQLVAGIDQSEQAKKEIDPNADLPPQKPLENPPSVIKAIYSTAWSAGSSKKVDYFIDLIKNTELNAIVIDIKDYTGTVSYDTNLELVNKYGAKDVKIPKINALIKKLHDQGIYVIARIAVFQDPVLAKARPDLALQSVSKGITWKDKKDLAWTDPASQEVWDYNIAIAKDAAKRGFDEINFDYIRFASDGDTDDIGYPFWDKTTPKHRVIADFFKYLKESIDDSKIKISADLFGLVTIDYGDMGIGQHLEDVFYYFDAIAPMVYPSHYHTGFNGYKNPALYPYEVVYASMAEAYKRLETYNQEILTATTSGETADRSSLLPNVKFRPWLQDFDLGADYDKTKVRAQIEAVYAVSGLLCDSLTTATTTQSNQTCLVSQTTPKNNFGGWMLWNPSNIYTKDALGKE